jgi:hypothetical protein
MTSELHTAAALQLHQPVGLPAHHCNCFFSFDSCRFKGIASTFRNLSGLDKDLDGQSASLNHQLDTDHSLQDSLLFYAAERDPQKYVDSFDQLVAFVDASLDLYRVSVQSTCQHKTEDSTHPTTAAAVVFVHSGELAYLKCCRSGRVAHPA